jgi:8-oxo-dGTP diphosphatase
MTRIRVAVGVIFHPTEEKVLIARRPNYAHQGGHWEFPGGKVCEGENIYRALCRELLEELAIIVVSATALVAYNYDYPDKKVRLESWAVNKFNGAVSGNEGQEIAWVGLDSLGDYSFPKANSVLLNSIKKRD